MKPLHQLIKETYQLGPAYHMTHVNNLESILTRGRLLSFNRASALGPTSIANDDIQAARANKNVPGTTKVLHDFVPLYFGFKTPMVACNQDKNAQVIFLRFSLDVLGILPGIVITDGNARSAATQFRLYTTLRDLDHLDVKAIMTVKYAGNLELKRKKQAELLVPDELAVDYLLDIICFNDDALNTVRGLLRRCGIRVAVKVNSGWYFAPRV